MGVSEGHGTQEPKDMNRAMKCIGKPEVVIRLLKQNSCDMGSDLTSCFLKQLLMQQFFLLVCHISRSQDMPGPSNCLYAGAPGNRMSRTAEGRKDAGCSAKPMQSVHLLVRARVSRRAEHQLHTGSSDAHLRSLNLSMITEQICQECA